MSIEVNVEVVVAELLVDQEVAVLLVQELLVDQEVVVLLVQEVQFLKYNLMSLLKVMLLLAMPTMKKIRLLQKVSKRMLPTVKNPAKWLMQRILVCVRAIDHQ